MFYSIAKTKYPKDTPFTANFQIKLIQFTLTRAIFETSFDIFK